MNKFSNKKKYLHIIIIILGIIFISIPIFHQNLWFDESYSVGIISKSFTDIWTIGSNDVHPVLYYWILHILFLFFGSNIYIYRIFSMIPIAILGILGYTHIRKDFGGKVGLLFSFFTFFLPISVVYSGEVRMYTWAMLLVSLMAIYAYRICKKSTIKNWILFGVFSLASAYTHYYALAAAGVINLVLMIYLIMKSVKTHKEDRKSKIYTKELKCFTISGVAQVLLYLPWLFSLLSQIQGVSGGFWIKTPSVELWLQIFIFQFTGNLDNAFVPEKLAIGFSILLIAYTLYTVIRAIRKRNSNVKEVKEQKEITEEEVKQNSKIEKEEHKDNIQDEMKEHSNKPGLWAIVIYIIVMIAVFLVSLKVPILYARYFLNLTGLFIFFMAFFIAKGGRKVLTIIICAITILVAIIANYSVTRMNYDSTNKEPVNYIQEDLQEGDLIFFGNEGSGFVLSMQLIDVANCFYDGDHWNVDPAYGAFGKDLWIIKDLSPMDDYKGRIWIINGSSYTIYEEFVQRYGKEDIQLIKQEQFSTGYHFYQYAITLIEKK